MKRVKYTLTLAVLIVLTGCELIKMRTGNPHADERVVARVNDAFLYRSDLNGIVPSHISAEDSTMRIEAYIESWIRKQLLIQEAMKKINIDEAEVERKILDYRYSIIAYEYQSHYVKNNLDTVVADAEIEAYHNENIDNFILKQNIVRATFVKVPRNAPQVNRLRELIQSKDENDRMELKSYCLTYSVAYHISDSTWMIFDDLVRNSPLIEIPNKVQFLKTNPFYQEQDDNFLYFLKVDEYRISDNVSPLEFVKDEIVNIVLNKRKVELAKKLENDVYNNALERRAFEIYAP